MFDIVGESVLWASSSLAIGALGSYIRLKINFSQMGLGSKQGSYSRVQVNLLETILILFLLIGLNYIWTFP